MKKAEIADRLAARTGLSKSVVKEAVDGAFAAIGDALATGEQVRTSGVRDIRHQEPAGPHRAQPEYWSDGLDIGVDTADIQGREDAEGCCTRRSRVVTLQRHPIARGRLHVEFSALLWNDGHSANSWDGAGRTQERRGVGEWAASDRDAGSHMRQAGRRGAWS